MRFDARMAAAFCAVQVRCVALWRRAALPVARPRRLPHPSKNCDGHKDVPYLCAFAVPPGLQDSYQSSRLVWNSFYTFGIVATRATLKAGGYATCRVQGDPWRSEAADRI